MGNLTETISIERGTYLGCSLSPLLFILVLENLATGLRQNKWNKGIQVDDTVFKRKSCTDIGVLAVMDSSKSLQNVMEFGSLSGYKIKSKKAKIVINFNATERFNAREIMKSTECTVTNVPIKYLEINVTGQNCNNLKNNYQEISKADLF